MLDITRYTSYRKYLADLIHQHKSNDSKLTLAKIGKSVGFSVSAVQMVLSGERNLTVHKIHDFASGLKLKVTDWDYFEALVHFEQSASPAERSFYQRRLKKIKADRPVHSMRITHKELLSEWYVPAYILYLVDIAFNEKKMSFDLDYKFVKKNFGLDKGEADRLLNLFETKGILDIRRDQKAHIVIDKVGGYLTGQQFLLKVVRECEKRIQKSFNFQSTYFESHNLTINREDFENLVIDYKKLLDKYIAGDSLAESGGQQVVYQTMVGMYPVTGESVTN